MASFETSIQDAITAAVRAELNKIVDEEIVKAKDAIDKRIRDSVGRLVLGVLKEFSVERNGAQILIRIKNDVNIQ